MNGLYDEFVRTVSLTVDKWSRQLNASYDTITQKTFVGADLSGACLAALGKENEEEEEEEEEEEDAVVKPELRPGPQA